MNLDPAYNYAPENIRHIHLMGICGTGMAALAGMLKRSGYRVTGSDSNVYPPMSDFLADQKIEIENGYRPENLNPPPDLVIVGNVITRKNPEAVALSQTDIRYLSFPQALSHFFISLRTSLVIAGTHGKTTTCSLLASSLYHAGLDPTFMIGGIVSEFGTNFRLGEGSYFVAEGDEYDTAFFDKQSKFLHYRPQVAVITSIEFDHADIFADLDAIKRSFAKFVSLIPEDGLLIANFDDENVREIAAKARCRVESYGLGQSCSWTFKNQQTSSGSSSFEIFHNSQLWGKMELAMAGTHNCLNALAVCIVMDHLGVSVNAMTKGLARFKGAKRRQEVRGVVDDITVIDDFAHHPTAVKETLASLKQSYTGKRLVTVFEPRTNSSRRSVFQNDYVSSFDAADMVILREPIPIEGLPEDELFSSSKLAQDLTRDRKVMAFSFDTTEKILELLQDVLRPGDVVAILSNGGFDNIHNRLLEQLRNMTTVSFAK